MTQHPETHTFKAIGALTIVLLLLMFAAINNISLKDIQSSLTSITQETTQTDINLSGAGTVTIEHPIMATEGTTPLNFQVNLSQSTKMLSVTLAATISGNNKIKRFNYINGIDQGSFKKSDNSMIILANTANINNQNNDFSIDMEATQEGTVNISGEIGLFTTLTQNTLIIPFNKTIPLRAAIAEVAEPLVEQTPPAQQAPTRPVADFTVSGKTIDASATSHENFETSTLQFKLIVQNGPVFDFQQSPIFQLNNLDAETYGFTLTVKDPTGLTANKNGSITIAPSEADNPTAVITYNKRASIGSEILVEGKNSSSPRDQQLTYKFELVDSAPQNASIIPTNFNDSAVLRLSGASQLSQKTDINVKLTVTVPNGLSDTVIQKFTFYPPATCNPVTDLNNDQKCDILDLSIAIDNFSKSVVSPSITTPKIWQQKSD